MLLTDWGVAAADSHQRYNVGYASAWLLLAACWVCQLIYLWTLVAPKCCPDREFT